MVLIIQYLYLREKIKLNKSLESVRSDITVGVITLIPNNFEAASEAAVDVENYLKVKALNVNNFIASEITS